ncbi:unnamed protein product [Paramecium octaurelia]|uniref:Uncharacterized protein n=1 Tax=Paramecium octaurelia TaxID=43137 RepID=A0A8S1TAU3_PAROT|nr:unnamed protein product [Paramecium octaurelia]
MEEIYHLLIDIQNLNELFKNDKTQIINALQNAQIGQAIGKKDFKDLEEKVEQIYQLLRFFLLFVDFNIYFLNQTEINKSHSCKFISKNIRDIINLVQINNILYIMLIKIIRLTHFNYKQIMKITKLSVIVYTINIVMTISYQKIYTFLNQGPKTKENAKIKLKMIKLNTYMLFLLCLANQQEQWDTIYQSFQDEYTMDASGWIVSSNFNGILFSACIGIRLFGGFNVFGTNAIISKQFSLPPHYQIKVTLEFWKIDGWDDEFVYTIVDDTLWQKNYQWWEGIALCGRGGGWNEIVENVTVTMNHNSESLVFAMTSNLNEPPYYESWGIRDFTQSIVRCPSGCLYCSEKDYNNCYQRIGILSLWHEQIELDGWMKNDKIQPATSKCISFDLVGGYLNLAPGDKLEKIIQNLSPHYTMQINFQFWIIDTRWYYNEYFQLFVDDQLFNQTDNRSANLYSTCGSTIELKLYLILNLNGITARAYWGIRAFNIYIAKCCKGCDQCIGPLKTDCILCSSDWVFYKNICTNTPPMPLSQISISQIKDSESDLRVPIEIDLLEVDQQINTQGNFTLSVKNIYKFLTVQVYLKCLPKTRIKSQFQNRLQDSNQYSFFKSCQQTFNAVIYNLKYEQRIITEQEIIVNTSDKQCVIYQVIKVVDELPFFIKILEIIIEDFLIYIIYDIFYSKHQMYYIFFDLFNNVRYLRGQMAFFNQYLLHFLKNPLFCIKLTHLYVFFFRGYLQNYQPYLEYPETKQKICKYFQYN